jgi:uncharacterized membrane protein YfhO
VAIRAVARRPGILVLTDAFFPGWKATVDGKPAHIYRINYLLRGVRLDTGVQRVEFRYQPASWRLGRSLSAVALVILFAMALIGWRRREAPKRGGSQPS